LDLVPYLVFPNPQIVFLTPATPNPPLHSDPAWNAFRSLSSSGLLGSAQRLGAGGAGELHSLGLKIRCPFGRFEMTETPKSSLFNLNWQSLLYILIITIIGVSIRFAAKMWNRHRLDQSLTVITPTSKTTNQQSENLDEIMEEMVLKQTPERAFTLKAQRAQQGSIKDIRWLGRSYKIGNFTTQDYIKAEYWLKFGAEKNDSESLYELGDLYLNGFKNWTKGIDMLTRAAMLGHIEAQGCLGDIYSLGKGVSKNDQIAYMWYSVAAVSSKLYTVKRDMIARELTSSHIISAQKKTQSIIDQINANKFAN
jgi:hypothetical protein